MGKLTQQHLKKLLHYNPDTGIFTCRVSRGTLKHGSIAGGKNNKGYIAIKIDGKAYGASRLAWLYMEGYFPEKGVEIDHDDRVRHNNKWKNLRMVSHSCNMKNVSVRCDNKSGVRGVWWRAERNKWCAQIKVGKGNKKLGSFSNIIDATKARWEAEKKYNYTTCNSVSSAYNFLISKGVVV